jgi:hypothetical protein
VPSTPQLAPRLDTAAALRAVQQMQEGARSSVGPVSGVPMSAGPASLPKTYEEPTSSSSSEARTRLYKPKAPARRQPGSAAVAKAPKKRELPLAIMLLGFLLVGFVAVASLLFLFRH